MDIIYLFKLLLKNKWLIVGISLFGVVGAFLMGTRAENFFVSSTKMATGFTESKKINIAEETFNPFEANTKFSNLIEMMQSETAITLLGYQLMIHDLTDSVAFRDPYSEAKEELPVLTEEEKTLAVELMTAKGQELQLLSTYDEFEKKVSDVMEAYGYDVPHLRHYLTIGRVKLSDFVTISFSSTDPELSAFVVNTMADEFLRYFNAINSSQTGQSVEILAKLVNENKEKLDSRSAALDDFKKANNLVNFDAEAQAKIAQLNEYEEQRAVEQQKVRQLTLSVSSLRSRLAKAEGGSTGSKNQKIFQLRREIDDLNNQYISAGSKDQALFAKINKKREELNRLLISSGSARGADADQLRAELENLELELEIAKSALGSANRNYGQIKSGIKQYGEHEAELKELQRELTLANDQYVTALEKYNKAKKTAEANQTANPIRVVQPGLPAGEPVPKKTFLKMALSGAGTFFVTVLVIIIMAYLDQSIRSPSRLKSFTGLPLIGTIPFLPKKKLAVAFDVMPEEIEKKKKVINYPENFRILRHDLMKSGQKVFLVTSTKDQEGKSFVVMNIAKSLAQTGKKVLILDAHFSNNLFSVRYEAEENGIEGALENPGQYLDFVKETENENISILGSKFGDYSPSEIMTPDTVDALFIELRLSYDYILIEGAPLNEFSGSRELEPFADGVVAVFGAKSVLREVDNDSIAYLKSLGPKVHGAVLNAVQQENMKN